MSINIKVVETMNKTGWVGIVLAVYGVIGISTTSLPVLSANVMQPLID
jgi:hypothetical protein